MIATNYENIKTLIQQLPRWEIERLIRDLSTDHQSQSIVSIYDSLNQSRNEFGVFCPHCKSGMTKKYGKKNGLQRYYCHRCKKTFTPTVKSVFYNTHKNKDAWFKFIELMLSGVSLRKSATICHINKNTALKWRHKILSVLTKLLSKNTLKGTIEMDDTYFKQSFKGEKGKSNKLLTKLRGISHNLICYTTAINRSNLVVAKFNGFGKNSIEKMQTTFNNAINADKNTILLTDEENAYTQWANTLHIRHIPINSTIVKRDNKLTNVNSLHSMLKTMIRRTHGVHSKHLDKYVQWVCWTKQIAKLSFSSQINVMFEDLCKTYVD